MRQQPHYLKVTTVAVYTLAVTGCAGMEDTFSDRGNRYCLQAGSLGALAGGAAGAGLGYAISQDSTGALIGGLLGALTAGVAGCQYGVWVADRREAYESEQARLNAELNNAAQTNESLAKLNENLRTGIHDREKQLAQIANMSSQAEQKRTEKERLARELAANREGIQAQLNQAEGELATHKRTLAELQRSSAQQVDPAELAEYQQRVKTMEQTMAELRGINQQYAKADSRVARL